MKCGIHVFELLICYIVWTSGIFVSFYEYLKAQNVIFEREPSLQTTLQDLEPGWTFLNRKQDVTDIEWNCWKFYINSIWAFLLFHFIVSEALRKINSAVLKYWYIISALGFIALKLGVKQILLTILQPVIFILVIVCGGKVVSIWITSLILLLTYNTIKYKHFFWNYMSADSSEDVKIFLLLIGMAWIKLRCISFCVDFVEKREKQVSEHKDQEKLNLLQTFINLLSYVYYLPLLYVGPIVLYEEFEKSFQTQIDNPGPRLRRFIWDMTLYGIYSFLLDIALHYIYFCAMYGDIRLIRELPSLAIAGGGLWMGFQFYTKYVITYGISGAFARLNNIDAPPTPRCIARIHVYSQMWRYFDVGLYKFLVKYIYKPSYSKLREKINMPKTVNKLLASFFTFVFIYLWHGTVMNIFIWSVLNYCGIVLENTAKAISESDWYKGFRVNVLKTEAMETRFIACLCAPLLTVSAVSNFYLFGGTEIGHLYVTLVFGAAFHNIVLVLISTYCCCIVSMTLMDVGSRTDIKKQCVKIE